jgi:hypothetical protein
MRFLIGRRVGPVWLGASAGPFHPSRILTAHGSGDRPSAGVYVLGAFFWLAVLLWLCLR